MKKRLVLRCKVLALKVPYVDIAGQHAPIRDEILRAVARVIDHGQFILGSEVEEFEGRFAALCQTRFAVGVNSGTDALILALRALGIGPGDEVITAPNSFVASASSIVAVGAQPVFVDVRNDYNMDPSQLEGVITAKTKAIMPVHLTGRPADMEPIMETARRHGLKVVEDCAQAILAEYRGKRVGSFGTIGCFSVHPLKTLNACGDGGVLTTDNASLCERLKVLRNLGLENRNECGVWSGNSRLDTLHAAILLVKMNYLWAWTEKRRAHAAFYRDALSGVPDLQVPSELPYEKVVYHTFVIQAERRDALREHLAEHGIGTAVHYPIPIHLQKTAMSLGYDRGRFPVTERQAERILSLPVYPELSQDQLEHVSQEIREFYKA